jgi:hypothetical protein
MPEAIMTLQFEGEAVDAGTMDVRQLAPALIAAADAMREAHLILRVPGPSPQVEVRATRPGSFIVDLLVAEPSIFQRAVDLLTSGPATATANLTALVTPVVGSFGLVKRLRNRKIRSAEQITPGLIRLVLDDGTTIETPPQSFQLVLDAAYRKSLHDLVEPLRGNRGITSVVASAEGQSETVTRTDLPAFEVPPTPDEELVDSETEVVLRPVNVAFSEGNKWRFHDGENTFYASIEDPEFLQAVELGTERFAKNDMLRVLLRTRQYKVDSGLRSERTVIRVLEHLPGARQLDLFAADEDDAANG